MADDIFLSPRQFWLFVHFPRWWVNEETSHSTPHIRRTRAQEPRSPGWQRGPMACGFQVCSGCILDYPPSLIDTDNITKVGITKRSAVSGGSGALPARADNATSPRDAACGGLEAAGWSDVPVLSDFTDAH
ncbi:hypothetical protein DPEC_G00285310 [Dallia pectoralis]|uniref:Uncharacterized protein n=1 Tax=Dallia pectoralis TaxID=75939 RepID=A0ACC2FJT3_DALPE|nr:hypothetical protein DPEC_G00285310 [Dallia pectoralis]